MASRIVITDDQITPRLKQMEPRLHAGLTAVMKMSAGRVQSDARANAPWQDQTGNARNGLMAKDYRETNAFGVVLYHTMPYGIWLETRWSGRYQIINPTIQSHGPQVMSLVNKLLARI